MNMKVFNLILVQHFNVKKIFYYQFFFLFFTLSYAEEQKIVYLNVDKIMQQSNCW